MNKTITLSEESIKQIILSLENNINELTKELSWPNGLNCDLIASTQFTKILRQKREALKEFKNQII